MSPTVLPSLRLLGHSRTPAPPDPPSDSTLPSSADPPPLVLPPPGPAHYEARRTQWLAAPAHPPRAPSPSTSRTKLAALLGRDGAAVSDDVWDAGLRSVWKGLVGGGRLRRRLPLAMVIKILKAGWVRDGTWPADAVAARTPSPVPPLPAPPHGPGDDDDEGIK